MLVSYTSECKITWIINAEKREHLTFTGRRVGAPGKLGRASQRSYNQRMRVRKPGEGRRSGPNSRTVGTGAPW